MRKILHITSFICIVAYLTAYVEPKGKLKEFNVRIEERPTAISAEPNTANIVVRSKIPNLTFSSSIGIKKIEEKSEGKWILTLYPGEQVFEIRAKGYMCYIEKQDFKNGKVYDCVVTGIIGYTTTKLYEIIFKFNVSDVYCSYGDLPPNLVNGKRAIFKLPRGKYTFSFSKDGYKPESITIDVKGDQAKSINLSRDEAVSHLPCVISIDTKPQEADVTIDGKKIGTTPIYACSLSVGNHQVVIQKNMFYTEYLDLTVEAGQTEHIFKKLRPKFGYLSATSHPDKVEVYLDGKKIGLTPITRKTVESGKHTLGARLPSYSYYDNFLVDFIINDNEEQKFRITTNKGPSLQIINKWRLVKRHMFGSSLAFAATSFISWFGYVYFYNNYVDALTPYNAKIYRQHAEIAYRINQVSIGCSLLSLGGWVLSFCKENKSDKQWLKTLSEKDRYRAMKKTWNKRKRNFITTTVLSAAIGAISLYSSIVFQKIYESPSSQFQENASREYSKGFMNISIVSFGISVFSFGGSIYSSVREHSTRYAG
ncbi:MAG: hypothetical protein DRP89_06775 [Candidatus Neomarinimicrobiota bacterium]|nr:MAG: hypothetical protein DRP89_06775 [Candidatus Neomarinimicrobiota bacterium]